MPISLLLLHCIRQLVPQVGPATSATSLERNTRLSRIAVTVTWHLALLTAARTAVGKFQALQTRPPAAHSTPSAPAAPRRRRTPPPGFTVDLCALLQWIARIMEEEHPRGVPSLQLWRGICRAFQGDVIVAVTLWRPQPASDLPSAGGRGRTGDLDY